MARRHLYPVACLLGSLAVAGCVARSAYVDQLSESQSKTADTVAYVAKSHADLATELGSPIAPQAQKIATIAEIQSADANDLKDISSGVNVAPIVQGALSGNWMEVLMGVVTVAAGGFAVQQRRKLTQANALTEEVADLEPVEARKVMRAKKVT